MPSTYSPNLRIELIAPGEQANTWGYTTNTNLGTLIEQAISGEAAITMADANYTLTALNGLSDESRQMILLVGGTATATRSVICPAVNKVYVVTNNTSGSQSIVIKTASGTGITVVNGTTKFVWCDGTDFHECVTAASSITLGADPSTGSQAATKNYVDTAISTAVANTYPFAAGTTLLFYQAAAPSGWTKSTALNDCALRVVSGTGGVNHAGTAFSSVFVSQAVSGTVGDTALTTAQIPSHSHGVNDPGHTHALPVTTLSDINYTYVNALYGNGLASRTTDSSTTGISIQSAGSGATHTHSFTGIAINMAVSYADFIICVRN